MPAILTVVVLSGLANCRPGTPGCIHLPLLERRGQDPRWDAYLAAVYGGTVQYPFDCGSLRWVFACQEPFNKSVVKFGFKFLRTKRVSCADLPPPVPTHFTPRRKSLFDGEPRAGEAWVPGSEASVMVPLSLFGVFVGGASEDANLLALRNGSWLEVIRVRSYPESRAFRRSWYFHAPGSGVFLHMGKTLISGDNPTGWANQRRLIRRAEALGYDTLALPASWNGSVTEVVDLRRPSGAARQAKAWTCGASERLRTGWEASRPCACNEDVPILNCQQPAGREGNSPSGQAREGPWAESGPAPGRRAR